jgi:hypothetical protein
VSTTVRVENLARGDQLCRDVSGVEEDDRRHGNDAQDSRLVVEA